MDPKRASFLAIARCPEGPDALARLAALTGLARVDATRLLTGTLPRVLLMNTPEGDRLVADLEAAGFRAFAANPSDVPTDRDRIVARRLAFAPGGCTVTDAQGQDHPCLGSAVAALVRGYRTVDSTEIEKTTERKLDLGKAILTSGLMV
ncbi:MAG TPA: hypothetical protein VF768_08485, partial [Holophagaceae bacterium]